MKKHEKMLSILLVIILSVNLISFDICATSNDYYKKVNNNALSLIRLNSKLLNETKEKTVERILKTVDMPSSQIDLIPTDKYEDISNATSVEKYIEYVKISENDEETRISKNEFEKAVSKIDNSKSSNEVYSGSETDSYFIKTLYIYKTLHADPGTYGIMSTFDWKNFTGTYRGKDILSLSGECLVFKKSSFSLAVQFTTAQLFNGTLTSGTETYYIDENSNSGDIIQSENSIACKYTLPANIPGVTYSYTYTDAIFLITCSARVQYFTLPCSFNVYSNYFHQRIFLTGSLSISITGANVSVSPNLSYWNKQITTTSQIVYEP
ncbi:MAG: hypothetical protein IJK26_03865 [Clostridia bacterium]|nr:hypothetical protein [Clostridia bacterium]